MISHALTIIVNELNHHLTQTYGISANHAPAGLRNLSSGHFPSQPGAESASPECLNLTLVSIQEDSSFRNAALPAHEVASAETNPPPYYLNALILLTATHASYDHALLMLSRAIEFFHAKSVFNNSNMADGAITQYAPELEQDRLSDFQLVLNLRSPTLEETHQLWTTLDQPQVPFALYELRQINLSVPHSQSAVFERRITPSKLNRD